MSYFRFWTIIVTLANISFAIFLPLDINFEYIGHTNHDSIYLIITILFAFDLVFMLVRQHNTKSRSIKNKVFFLTAIDVLASIPFGFIQGFKYLYVLQLLKLIKVRSLMRQTILKNLKYSGQLKLCFLGFWLVISSHWISCGWLYVRGMEPGVSAAGNYIKSIYWTVTTLTSVGYGDITPNGNGQMLYAMVVQVLGFSVFGYIIGVIAGIFAQKNPAQQLYLDNLEKLRTMVHYRRLPEPLQEKVTSYYKYIYEKKLGYDESEFLKSLPNNLREVIALQLKKDVIELIPLFKDIKSDIVVEIALNLKLLILTPGDYLFRAGDLGNDMYFIIKGEIQILSDNEETILTSLTTGAFLGEIALFKNINRTATAKASKYSDLYSLNRVSFEKVIQRYPDVKQQLEQEALAREKRYKA